LGNSDGLFFLISLCSAGCRIKSKAPYWIQTHGGSLGGRVVGWEGGALLLGGDQHLWCYPGTWATPWVPRDQSRALRAIAAAKQSAYGLFTDGRVARFSGGWSPTSGGGWSAIEGSAAWGASELSMTDDGHLLLIANGKLRVLEGGALKSLDCDALDTVAVAGTHGDGAFVLDAAGALYFNGAGRCDKINAPVPLQRIAANSDRLLAVAVDGSVWRRRANVWSRLPAPSKYRTGQTATDKQAQDVGVSAYSTWLVDAEGAVFLLSDET